LVYKVFIQGHKIEIDITLQHHTPASTCHINAVWLQSYRGKYFSN